MGPALLPAPRSPTMVPGDWAIALPRGRSGQNGRCDAARTPRLHPHPKALRIVMLVASDPHSSSREALGLRPVTHNPVARESRQKPPGLPPRESGSVRRGIGSGDPFRPPGGSETGLPPCRSRPLVRRAETPLSVRHSRLPQASLLTARHSLHLRFAMPIPGNLRGVFSNAAAGIAARSLRYVFPFRFSGFPRKLQVRFHRLDKAKLRLESESRKRKVVDLSTGRAFCGGQLRQAIWTP